MGIFKEASESLFKYSEKLINKTEEYARIAKLNMDIKRLESNIDKVCNEIGDYVLKKIDAGEKSLSLDDEFLAEKTRTISVIRHDIEAKRHEITGIKTSPTSGSGDGKSPGPGSTA
jgi:hypothetical protein